MAFWTVDLTTHDGATGAAELGGTTCFVAAGLSVVGVLVIGLLQRASGADWVSATIAAGVEAAIFTVAGFRLRAGKGVIWGCVASVLMVVEMIAKLVTLTGLFGLIMNAVLLVGIVNGVRGALALRRGISDPDEMAETFR